MMFYTEQHFEHDSSFLRSTSFPCYSIFDLKILIMSMVAYD